MNYSDKIRDNQVKNNVTWLFFYKKLCTLHKKCDIMKPNNEIEVKLMGWFAKKYGKNTHPKMSIDTYCELFEKFGENYANELLEDVQDEIYSEKRIVDTYLNTKNKKEHKSNYELADFCRGGELSEDD